MIIKPQKVQHYRVKTAIVSECEVGDAIYSRFDWAPDAIGFITAVYPSSSEIDIMLFEPMPAPDNMIHCYAEKCTPEEVEAYLLNPNP